MVEIASTLSFVIFNNVLEETKDFFRTTDQPKNKVFNLVANYLLSMINLSKSQVKCVQDLMKLLVSINNFDFPLNFSYETEKRKLEQYQIKHKEKLKELTNDCDCFCICLDEATNDIFKYMSMVARIKKEMSIINF